VYSGCATTLPNSFFQTKEHPVLLGVWGLCERLPPRRCEKFFCPKNTELLDAEAIERKIMDEDSCRFGRH
jgi:hypothetical protein